MNRILLLEDDVSLIDGLVYSLKKNEFDVEVARTVCEAKQYLSELDRYDLLILDVTLPDGTGFDVSKSWECCPTVRFTVPPVLEQLFVQRIHLNKLLASRNIRLLMCS